MILLIKFSFCYQFACWLGTRGIATQKAQPIQGDFIAKGTYRNKIMVVSNESIRLEKVKCDMSKMQALIQN